MTVTDGRLAHLERRSSWQNPRWMELLREAACEALQRAEATSGARVLTWAGLATSMEARGFEGTGEDLRELAKIQGAALWQLQWWAVKGQWWAAKTVDGAQVLYRPEDGELAPTGRRRREDGVVEIVEAREQFVAVDIESTGFSPARDRIIEVGLVAFRGGREIASWSSLVNPHCKVPAAVTRLTGLSSRDLRAAPSFEAIAAHVHRYLSRARVVVAHNASFDKRMLAGEFARLGLEWPEVELVCTQQQAKELSKAGALAAPLPNVKLDTVCRLMGVELADHHRAEDDARACGKLLLALDARRRELGQQQEMWG